jgi:predicted nucleic acid-binding protein
MNAVFLDTSFVIALLNRSDPHHEKAKSLSAEIAGSRRPRLTTAAVLVELGDGFARKGRWDLIAPFLLAAERDPLLEIASVDFATISGAALFRDNRRDKDWGLTDCISFIIMEDRRVEEALTADHHFQQAGFRALLLEP